MLTPPNKYLNRTAVGYNSYSGTIKYTFFFSRGQLYVMHTDDKQLLISLQASGGQPKRIYMRFGRV